MAKGIKIVLTDRQEKWLIRHYMHTKNEEIAQKLGISQASVHRFARALGLKKSRQYMVKCQQACSEAAKQSHLINNTYPPKGYKIPGREKYRFKPGESSLDRLGPKREAKRIQRAAESRKKTYKIEKARAIWGLERRTKLRVLRQPREKTLLRYYLKKRGYIVDDAAFKVYYNSRTHRGKRIEAKNQPWYKFYPMPMQKEQE